MPSSPRPSVRFARALGIVLALLALAVPIAAGALPAWRERYLATLRACRGAGSPGCHDSLVALRALLPGHPTVVVALARAALRAGDRAGAIHALATCASMGLALDLARDSLLATLAGDPAFQPVARRMAANAEPRAAAQVLHRFADAALLTEDVAWDPASRRWLVSSIHERRIVCVDGHGIETDFLAPGEPRPWGVFALGVDVKSRRLWASMAATAEMESLPPADRGRAALACYDLDRGTLIRRWDLAAPGASHVLGDLTVGSSGEVYVTDSAAGGVYRAVADADSLETLLPPGSLVSPQTPVLAAGGAKLLIAEYSRGIASLDLATRQLRWLEQPEDLASVGIDGLYAWRGGLIAIQNGTEPHRVIALELDAKLERILRWRVLEQASPWLGEPNHGAVIGDRMVLIGNSGWDRVGDDGVLRADASTRPPVLLELKLEPGTSR
jgi:hypothetical protein